MHARRWTCTAQHNTRGRMLSNLDRGLVRYRPWDMQSIFSEQSCWEAEGDRLYGGRVKS